MQEFELLNPCNLHFFSCNLINFSFCQEERINDEDEEWWIAVESTASLAELKHFNYAGYGSWLINILAMYTNADAFSLEQKILATSGNSTRTSAALPFKLQSMLVFYYLVILHGRIGL